MTISNSYKALLSGSSWAGAGTKKNPVVITYSYPTKVQPYLKNEGGYSSAAIKSWRPLSASERSIVEASLKNWSSVAGVKFVRVAAGQGDITFAKIDFDKTSNAGFAGFAYYPGRSIADGYAYSSHVGGDAFFNTRTNYDKHTVIHEIGHALGLKHPFDGDVRLDATHDNSNYSVMSYTGRADVPAPYDVDAVRYLYGSATPAKGTLISYKWSSSSNVLTQKWGDKASHIAGSSSKDSIDAGGGNDTVAGFDGNDTIKGGAGKDLLMGNDGNDLLMGGSGNDRLFGDTGNDRFLPGPGDDTVDGGYDGKDTIDYSAMHLSVAIYDSYASGAEIGSDQLSNIEIFLTGSGDDTVEASYSDDLIRTGTGNDSLNGYYGRDTLEGGAGDDTMTGGYGGDADRFVYTGGNDVITDLYEEDGDTLVLDHRLWSGTLTVDQILAMFASVTPPDYEGDPTQITLSFGGANSLAITSSGDLNALRGHIEIV